MANDRDITQVLQLNQSAHGLMLWWKWLVGALVLAALVAFGVSKWLSGKNATVQYKTVEASRGALTVRVTATGVLQPVTQVEVGTEISGTVEAVLVDFNARVAKGQALARLNTDQLAARLRQTEAALALAEARVREMEATVVETDNSRRRAQEMAKQGLCTQEECDEADAASLRAQAALASSKAQVAQTQAQLDADRTSMNKAVIRSPINGMVLKRQIEPGQTVAASLQTPVLFVLAENLTQMELHVAVDEADVGQVKEGQHGTFAVDAYPDRSYPAVITSLHYAPQTVEGVVTYETILSADNADLSLRPGMTATADIAVRHLDDVLQVPNAALRFTPAMTETRAKTGGLTSSLFGRPPSPSGNDKRKGSDAAGRQQRVWVLRDGVPASVAVKTGATDGKFTEIRESELAAGTPVIVDVAGK